MKRISGKYYNAFITMAPWSLVIIIISICSSIINKEIVSFIDIPLIICILVFNLIPLSRIIRSKMFIKRFDDLYITTNNNIIIINKNIKINHKNIKIISYGYIFIGFQYVKIKLKKKYNNTNEYYFISKRNSMGINIFINRKSDYLIRLLKNHLPKSVKYDMKEKYLGRYK